MRIDDICFSHIPCYVRMPISEKKPPIDKPLLIGVQPASHWFPTTKRVATTAPEILCLASYIAEHDTFVLVKPKSMAKLRTHKTSIEAAYVNWWAEL